MPIDAVWMVATVPQRSFERRMVALRNKMQGLADDDDDDGGELSNDEEPTTKKEDKPTNHDLQKRATDQNNRSGRKLYMEKTLEDALEYLSIFDSVWVPSKNGHYYHVYFTCDLDSNDHAMHYLKSKGIGSEQNSTVGYIPFSLFYFNEKPDPNDPTNYNQNYFNDIQDSFIRTVTSRMTVAQVVEGVRAGSAITFDYYMYLLWSCTIAAMGIMNTSPIDVAASMMIEPLMGCVMAISFGLAIHNRSLLWIGTKGLVVGMVFCLLFGYIYGLIFQIWRVAWNPPGGWPTPEMVSRGQYKSLIYGSVIATAGGAVLAVILLKNNLVALTGVAVATTFMPPILNTGLCWALATHLQIDGNYQTVQAYNISGEVYYFKPSWAPPDGYETQYVYDMRIECVILGAISAAYTGINVFWLLFASYALLKIKEIAPIRTMMPNEHKFFSEDIKVYRAHQKRYGQDRGNTGLGGGRDSMGEQIFQEWADLTGLDRNRLGNPNGPEARATRLQTLEDIAADVEADAGYQAITRGAFGHKYQPQLRRRLTEAQIENEGILDSLRGTKLNNLGIFTVDDHGGQQQQQQQHGPLGGVGGGPMDGVTPPAPPPAPFSYAASIRRSMSRRNPATAGQPINYGQNPYSVWPSVNNGGGGVPSNVPRNRGSRASSIGSTAGHQF